MSIRLTQPAADKVHRYFSLHRHGVGLRLGVKKIGCSGFAYVVNLADKVTDEDEVYEDRGVRIVVNSAQLPLLRGTEIDFVREGLNETFAFRNPNVKTECGCGESFAV